MGDGGDGGSWSGGRAAAALRFAADALELNHVLGFSTFFVVVGPSVGDIGGVGGSYWSVGEGERGQLVFKVADGETVIESQAPVQVK